MTTAQRSFGNTPLLLSLFYVFGVLISCSDESRLKEWIDVFAETFIPPATALLSTQFRLLALLFLLGSSIVGFLIIPAAFLLRGISAGLSADLVSISDFTKEHALLALSSVLSLSGLILTGSQAFDSSRTLYACTGETSAVWRPMAVQVLFFSVLLEFLAAFLYSFIYS